MVVAYLYHFLWDIIDNNNLLLLSGYKTTPKLVIEPKRK